MGVKRRASDFAMPAPAIYPEWRIDRLVRSPLACVAGWMVMAGSVNKVILDAGEQQAEISAQRVNRRQRRAEPPG